MASEYDITVQESDYAIEEEALEAAAWHVLNIVQSEAVALSVAVVSDERIRQLNRDYAGNDYVTDVLSFAAEDDEYLVEPDDLPYIGDVIVAHPTAERQAEKAGHGVRAELQTLVVHGTLHLLGFDHKTPDEQAEMWAYQSAAMDALRAEGW